MIPSRVGQVWAFGEREDLVFLVVGEPFSILHGRCSGADHPIACLTTSRLTEWRELEDLPWDSMYGARRLL